jgi:hypothetical protein
MEGDQASLSIELLSLEAAHAFNTNYQKLTNPRKAFDVLKHGCSIEVFCSYSHKDEVLWKELVTHLVLLQRQGIIRTWYDRKISAGTEWEKEIHEHLESAGIILLLVSADFLASDYCYALEMQRAMERHEARKARVIPIILRAVDWREAPFAKLQALPKNGKPVTSWSNRDEAFTDIAQGIKDTVREFVNTFT